MTNLLLHIINVLLFFSLVHQLAGDAGGGTPARAAATLTACAAASLFAVHPMMTEVVGYVSGRSELLSGVLFLSSLLCVWRTFVIGGRRWLAGAIVLFVAGLLYPLRVLFRQRSSIL